MIRFLLEILKKHTKLAKIVKISEIFNRLVFPLNFNRFCHPMTLHQRAKQPLLVLSKVFQQQIVIAHIQTREMSPSRYDLSGKENLGSHIDIQSDRSVQRRASFPEQGNAIYQQENTNVVPINVIKYPTDLQREDY